MWEAVFVGDCVCGWETVCGRLCLWETVFVGGSICGRLFVGGSVCGRQCLWEAVFVGGCLWEVVFVGGSVCGRLRLWETVCGRLFMGGLRFMTHHSKIPSQVSCINEQLVLRVGVVHLNQ